MVQLEGEAQAAQQKAMQSDQECAAVQAALDKAHSELALTARRLTESDKTLTATQNRLKTVEASLADAQADRQRLSAALDEANHKHLDAMNMQNSRFEALQARANLTENLLEEARQTLTARADEIRSFERRVIETTTAHDNSDERIAQLKAALAERENQIREFEQSHAALHEHNQMLRHAVAARESAQDAAQQKIQEQADLVRTAREAAPGRPQRQRDADSISSTRSSSASSSNGAWPKARWNPAARTSPACCAKSAPCSTGAGRTARPQREAPQADSRTACASAA